MFDLTLSFDNGPEPDVTPAVLDALAARNIRTTFFVIGEKLEDPVRRKLSERTREEGHWIGNHTFTHSVPLGKLPEPQSAVEEIDRTQGLIGDLVHPERLFRPFGGGGRLHKGLLSRPVVSHLIQGRYTCVLWNAIPRDWDDPDGWVERALDQCGSQDWTLMVLHDLPTGAMRHLDSFLDQAVAAGARLRQDFPPNCVPIRRGEIVRPIEAYVSDVA
jgi:peptidoglycan/xylan/chitin deacetylase (PgdA/CDA1 family)